MSALCQAWSVEDASGIACSGCTTVWLASCENSALVKIDIRSLFNAYGYLKELIWGKDATDRW